MLGPEAPSGSRGAFSKASRPCSASPLAAMAGLVNRTRYGRKYVIGIAAHQSDSPYNKHQNYGQHNCVLGNVLTVLIAEKSFNESLFSNEDGQDIAEYAVMLAVILVLVVGTIRLVGSNANNVFSSVSSSVH